MCIMLTYTYVVYLNTSSGCSSSMAEFLKQSFMKLLVLTALICACGFASAEAVYKCTDNGKVSYSNEPCLGAQRVDTMATRGLDKI